MVKLGRNDKCMCGSGKKYKTCCLNKVEEQKKEVAASYVNGHEVSSDNVKMVHDYLAEEYRDHKVIDVTNILTEESYKPMQMKNYSANIIMVAERNDTNESVFSTRAPSNVNLMVLYRGAYQCFQDINFDSAKSKINDMIEKRFNGESV